MYFSYQPEEQEHILSGDSARQKLEKGEMNIDQNCKKKRYPLVRRCCVYNFITYGISEIRDEEFC